MRTFLRLKKQQRRKLPTEFQHPANLIHRDTRELSSYQSPPIDLSITSPPYMAAHDTADPFTNHTQAGAGYTAWSDACNVGGQPY